MDVDISAEDVFIGNGVSECIDFALRALLNSGDELLVPSPDYPLWSAAVVLNGGVPRYYDCLPANEFQPDIEQLEELVSPRTRAIVLINPNNPTGTWLTPAVLEDLFNNIASNVIIVLDLAYTEYMDDDIKPPINRWLKQFPNLLITQTFSKVYALAGLRIGYSISNPEIADILNRVRQPFNTNLLAQAAAIASLDDREHVVKSVQMNNTGKAFLQNAFNEMGLDYLPTMGNFISVNMKQDGLALYQKRLEQGVIVRPVANYAMPEYLRITIGTQAQNERFIETLKRCL